MDYYFYTAAEPPRLVFLLIAAAAKRFEVFLNLSAGGSIAPFSYFERFSSRSFLMLAIVLYVDRGILLKGFSSMMSKIAAHRARPTSSSISTVKGGGYGPYPGIAPGG